MRQDEDEDPPAASANPPDPPLDGNVTGLEPGAESLPERPPRRPRAA